MKTIIAKTHPAEYKLHKYWARKPYNIINTYLSSYVKKNGKIFDPFCGSGVILNEARKLNIQTYGCDVNPIAYLISKVTLTPINITTLSSTFKSIINKLIVDMNDEYTLNGKTIKYVVHQNITQCPTCKKQIKYTEIIHKKKCPYCESKISFSLENTIRTEVIGICLEGEKNLIDDPELCKLQEQISSQPLQNKIISKYNYKFSKNNRILAFENMYTNDLFTNRNFNILCKFADLINIEVCSDEIKDACKLLLSASIAQCSSLIPYRNNMSTGGPAWSIPGFWVPAVHLETNPIIHIKARAEKIIKGLSKLNEYPITSFHLFNEDALTITNSLIKNNIKFDLIFLDPPYGDSVPYVEFSSIWNSFLNNFINPKKDISVSDRESKKDSWNNYNSYLLSLFSALDKILEPAGKILITFNNHDMQAWVSLMKAIQNSNFKCISVAYQIPAVISSKAQKSRTGSYLSDFYCVFEKSPEKFYYSKNITTSIDQLKLISKVRNNHINKNQAYRSLIYSFLKNNIDYTLYNQIDVILDTFLKNISIKTDETILLKNQYSPLKIQVLSYVEELLNTTPLEYNILVKKIIEKFSKYELVDTFEISSILENHLILNKNQCIALVY